MSMPAKNMPFRNMPVRNMPVSDVPSDSDSEDASCPICAEDSKRMVRCQFCSGECCRKCFQTYLMTSTSEPKCMFPNCKKAIDLEFILKTDHVFYKDVYSNYLAGLIVQREKAHLASTQQQANNYKLYCKLTSKAKSIRACVVECKQDIHECECKETILLLKEDEIELLKDKSFRNYLHGVRKADTDVLNEACLRSPMRRLVYQMAGEKIMGSYDNIVKYWEERPETLASLQEAVKVFKQAIEVYSKKRAKLEAKYRRFCKRRYIFRGESKTGLDTEQAPQEAKQPKIGFTYKCPYADCKGYITKDKCGMCKGITCKQCLSPMEKDHVCDKDNLATAKLIKSDTKPCPRCKTLIFKISGCYQMWCTQCHTAFHWNTGEICTGNIHNPHYMQWAVNNPGAQQHVNACGELPTPSTLSFKFDHCTSFRFLQDVLLNVLHIQDVEYEKYRAPGDQTSFFMKLRVEYLLGNISESVWVTKIRKHETKNLKHRLILNLLEMWANSASDILINLGQIPHHDFQIIPQGYSEAITQLWTLLDYVMKQFHDICTSLGISKNFFLYKRMKAMLKDGKELMRDDYFLSRHVATT